ncbi:heterokaryon incompatibility protein-domain-containing protein [Schizothecium vesticola]|uniref:Heterokaryon incompatibility protein-domain-containing protein n=1 Tax=Schizothecium vesticola TaxID=314040 RepID=A0AA40FB85_9PEZI|nr:heterokaryon incompatibility protein-domain-containing protein [Schizothecium vesticola]
MLCQACKDILNGKSTKWKGSYKAAFDSGDGGGQLTGTDSTTLDPEADSSDDTNSDSNFPRRDFHFNLSKPGGFVHHLSGRAFLAAAHEGCLLCLRLECQLSPKQRLAIAEEPEDIDISSADYDYVVGYGMSFWQGDEEWTYRWRYRPRTLNDIVETGQIDLELQLYASKDQEPLAIPDPSYPTAVGQGESSISLVRRWIATCEEHDDCRLRSLSDVYKTQGRPRFARIIDVQEGPSDPRLSDVDKIPAGAIYMTLSHCWGDPKHKPLTLTLNTLVAFKAGIPWNKIPKTFADAMVFTRNMGIRYIWIDSLCIIQDCADDWESQSAVMCEVYSGSYLNLAATGAADSRGGLFAERDGRLVQPLRVAQPWPPRKPSSSDVRYYNVVDEKEWGSEVERAPLCQRGWIIQERALARRSLHFGRRQLYWECTSMRASESVPLGYPGGYRDFKRLDPLLLYRTPTGAALVETWGRLVENYTRAGLTKETDKLVAISGLAKALAAQSDIPYLSGLWNYDLKHQLLWWAESASKRPDIFRAPSWSWASTNSKIRFNTYKEAYAITILSVRVSPASPSGSFTTFKSSPMTIRGVLIPGVLDMVDYELRAFIARKKLIGTTGAHHSPWNVRFRPDSDFEQDNRGPVLLLPTDIGARWSNIVSSMDGRLCTVDVSGMVLKATGVKGTLRRVGIFVARESIPKQHPLRKVWLLDYNGITSSTDPSNDKLGDCEATPPRNTLDSISSKTNPLEGVSEDLYHHYEEIGNSGDQAEAALEWEFDWTRVFCGGFTFDLV